MNLVRSTWLGWMHPPASIKFYFNLPWTLRKKLLCLGISTFSSGTSLTLNSPSSPSSKPEYVLGGDGSALFRGIVHWLYREVVKADFCSRCWAISGCLVAPFNINALVEWLATTALGGEVHIGPCEGSFPVRFFSGSFFDFDERSDVTMSLRDAIACFFPVAIPALSYDSGALPPLLGLAGELPAGESLLDTCTALL